jgi:urocanate hydratase
MLHDVMTGVSRRAWALNPNAIKTVELYHQSQTHSAITLPEIADSTYLDQVIRSYKGKQS